MTRTDFHKRFADLRALIAQIVAEFGFARTAVALLLQAIVPKSRPPNASFLSSDHLRKDVGLPPNVESNKEHWERHL